MSSIHESVDNQARPFATMEEAGAALWRVVCDAEEILYPLRGCASALASLSQANLEAKSANGAVNPEDRGLDFLAYELLRLIEALHAWDDRLTAPAMILMHNDLDAIAKRDAHLATVESAT